MLSTRKLIKEALADARHGGSPNLAELVIPRSGGSVAKAEAENKSRIRPVVWSDKSVDEDNDTIEPSGWILDRFLKNGTTLWAHDNSTPPLGAPLNTGVSGQGLTGKLVGDIDFFTAETNPFAEMILRMIDAVGTFGVSVGFRPVKWVFDEERGGIDFLEQRLLEGSVVPVGSNPSAMVEAAKSADIDLRLMSEWAEKTLDDDEAPLEREAVEAVYKALGPWRKTPAGVVTRGGRPKQQALEFAPAPSRDTETDKAKQEKADEAMRHLAAVIDGLDSGHIHRSLIFSLARDLGAQVIDCGAISWDRAHANGTPRAVKDAVWDEKAEQAAADADDMQAMAAWEDPEHRGEKDSYRFTHHRAGESHPVVWSAVKSAMHALVHEDAVPDADRRAVYDHLAKHYRDDFDEEPPELREPGVFTVDDVERAATEAATEAALTMHKHTRELESAVESAVNEAVDEMATSMNAEILRETGGLPV